MSLRRVVRSLIFCSLFVWLTACGYDDEDFVLVEDEEKMEQLANFVTEYKEQMIRAVNESGFSLIEGYVIENTSFSNSLNRYINDMRQNGTKKELIEFEVKDMYWNEENNYLVDVFEEVEITTVRGTEREERELQYEVVQATDDTFRVFIISQY